MTKPKFLMLLFLGIASLQSTCSTTRLLHANFETDTVNSFPDVNLPGGPDGDRIDWYGDSNDGRLKVVSRTNGSGETSKWLQLDQNTRDAQFYPGILSFVPGPGSSGGAGYTFSWKGYIDVPTGANNPLDLLVSISENQSHRSDRVVSLVLRAEAMVRGERSRKYGVYLRENGSYSDAPVGYVRTGGAHSVSILLFEETREYHILGLGQTIVRDFPEGIELVRPSLHFLFDGFPGIGVYRTDNMFILQGHRNSSR